MESKINGTLNQLYAEHTGKVSDKWSLYLNEYDRLFSQYREKPVSLLEIGIQNGGSLEIWSLYFSNAQVLIGCDVNEDCHKLTYEDPRIRVIVGDATLSNTHEQILQCASAFDIVIDDGSHFSGDIIKAFALYFPNIKEGGLFVAEDLHCSYWGSYEGGLYYPYSSMSFFKRLADVINHEHWGVAKVQEDVLKGIFAKYDCGLDIDILAQVHSIEFINSMCVVRKATANQNNLGLRCISGTLEVVVPNFLQLNGAPYKLGIISAQSDNPWSTRDVPPDESILETEFQYLNAQEQISELNHSIAGLNQLIRDRDEAIVQLNQTIETKNEQIEIHKQEINELRNSSSWRITAPLRYAVNTVKNLTRLIKQKKLFHIGVIGFIKRNSTSHGGFREWLIVYGRQIYRQYFKSTKLGRLVGRQILKYGLVSVAELQIAALKQNRLTSENAKEVSLEQIETDFGIPGFHLSLPLNLEVADALFLHPHINVLLPSLRLKHMSGGPNTALILAALLVEKGERVRLIACDASVEGEEAALFPHIEDLLKRQVDHSRFELVDAFDRTRSTQIGANDIFLATAWWTAQIAKYATAKTLNKTFVYLIQDFEPILHEGSTFQARALETYGLAHIPVINTKLLLDHLVKERAGCYSDAIFAHNALWFEPALDRRYYFPEQQNTSASSRKKTLLFYARPTSARRNLFELGLMALRKAVASGVLDKDNWEIWAMGEKLDPIPLGNGCYLNPLPWMAFEDYAQKIRQADLLLSLMLSPHPSYPPLEMAAAGKLVVTNGFSVKTVERMTTLSPNIIVAEPTLESVAAALENTAGRINAGIPSYDPSGNIELPTSWDESLSEIASALIPRIEVVRALRSQEGQFALGYPAIPKTEYENYRRNCLRRRRHSGVQYKQEPGLLSFITSAFNTAPEFLEELAVSVLLQDGGMHFEWFILDNGSTDENTQQTLKAIGRYPGVRLERVEANLGIIGGMRYCLERAGGRYIMPLDSDDLVEPDCVNVLTRFIQQNNYPALLYTDEDKLADGHFGSPYFKPDWDPVLFLHSCYIAHLCVIERELALKLELYTDKSAEGCHDWDSFIRFMNAGHIPCHVPEVLYSWRIHQGSTSGNIASKSYITESHRTVLQKVLDQSGALNLELTYSPLFNHNVDWRFLRKQEAPVSCMTLTISNRKQNRPDTSKNSAVAVIYADLEESINEFSETIAQIKTDYVHLLWDGILPDDNNWLWEAVGLFELFPDAVVVGGALHDGDKVIDGPKIFGFGKGFDCPDRARGLSDPGYSAIMWKPHTVSAISAAHCVVNRKFLIGVLPILVNEKISLEMLGPWLGALAFANKQRIVYSPFMRARALAAPEEYATSAEIAKFLSMFWGQIPDKRFYSQHFGLTVETAYQPVYQTDREVQITKLQDLTLSYGEWLEHALKFRKAQYPVAESTENPKITLITPIYQGSDLKLLDELAQSIADQSVLPTEWLLIVNGEMPQEAMQLLKAKIKGEWRARLIVEAQAGIVSALYSGLQVAIGDYVIPVDADDLITLDAIQIITHEIMRLDFPDCLFSDEDLLVDGKPSLPFLRGQYDKVLALENSTIWHICAMKKEAAIEAKVYANSAANWCQDWDSISRIAQSGGRIAHVPEVLYHWRQHSGSTTNNKAGDPRSLDSVRSILERHIQATTNPELFFVEEWPVSRGSKELYIAKRPEPNPNFIWFGDLDKHNLSNGDDLEILAFVGNGVFIESVLVYEEVARLFALHPHLAAVGGNTVNEDGLIVDGCYVLTEDGDLQSPWIGRLCSEGGPYALALKPQSVAVTGNALAFFRISALKQAGLWSEKIETFKTPVSVCCRLQEKNWGVAFSPLIRAKAGSVFQSEKIDNCSLSGKSTGFNALARYGNTLGYRYHC